MQTFLPYASFEESAKCLDYKRLGKQRVESRQILNAIDGKTVGWRNHPASIMWRKYRSALIEYSNVMITEWINRGYKNSMQILQVDTSILIYPKWLGDERFHSSHRSNLLRKDFEYYSAFGWKEDNSIPYFWPD
jgi:hypothetical protein